MIKMEQPRASDLITILKTVGFPRQAGKVLTHFIMSENGIKLSAVDIEQRTRMRQPEVSVGATSLVKMHWLKVTPQKKESKGRPVHLYEIAVERNIVYDWLAEKLQGKLKEIQLMQQAVAELKKAK
jgi:predicted transcriptional regulator